MNSINLHAHRSLISSTSSFSKQIGQRNPLFPALNGVAFVDLNPPRNSQFCEFQLDWGSRKDVLKFSVRSEDSAGGRPLQPGRREEEDEDGSESSLSSDDILPKSKQEKVKALFRRILSSISKAEEAKRAKQTKDDLSQKSPTESLPKVLRQSKKRVATAAKSKKGAKVSPRKRVANNDDKMQKKTHLGTSFNVNRPPSNFMKRSPIPSLSIPRGKPIEENNDIPATTDHGKVSTSLPMEEMKLPQLKELAKSRGIKGYSKLKKSQLLELLSSQILKQ